MVKKILLEGIVLSALFLGALDSSVIGDGPKNISLLRPYEPFVVLELFTSQGCSSCPPADMLLEKTKNRALENVIALSYHVDYWNYIGWLDPFSDPSFTLKQQKYNIKFRNRSNYTPQLVVNGSEHFVGSKAETLNSAIDKYLVLRKENFVDVIFKNQENDRLFFEFEVKGEIAEKKLRGILALDKRVTEVKRGENKSRTLSNDNIVVVEKYFPLLKAKGLRHLEIPDMVRPGEKLLLVLLLENEEHDILGAAKVEISS